MSVSISTRDVEAVTLRVDPGSPHAEVFLVDHRLRLAARSVGPLVTRQPPGVYKVKVQEARTVRERMILLTNDEDLVFPPSQIDSSAPLAGAARTHEYQVHGAWQRSRQIDFVKGKGGQLFFLARHWSAKDPGRVVPRSEHPARRLALAPWDGSWRLDLSDLPIEDAQRDAWCAVNVELDPGTYVLQAALSDGAMLEQAVVVSPGWQSQVFLLSQPDPAPGTPTTAPFPQFAPVLNTTVMMGRTGFEPADPQLHVAEVARFALADDRPVRAVELDDMLRDRFDNPILGILGAHLLRLARMEVLQHEDESRRKERLHMHHRALRRPQRPFDQALFNTVVGNLRSLWGNDHPDVQALALEGAETSELAAAITSAPMLRPSWSLLVKGSELAPGLVPIELWQRIAMRAATTPFLSWVRFPNDSAANSAFLDELRAQASTRLRTAADTVAGAPAPAPKPEAGTGEAGDRLRIAAEMEIPRKAAEWLLRE
jgi:hypothetical protein